MKIVQKENFNQWNETEFERNLCTSHTYTKSKEFSIDAYSQKNIDISNKDINNISAIALSSDEILESLSKVKKKNNNKDTKIATAFPISESISSDVLDTNDIFLNNEIIETMKISCYFNLSKIMMFLHKIHLGKKLNKKSYMSCIVSIIILFLQYVNASQKIEHCTNRFRSICDNITFFSPYINSDDLHDTIFYYCHTYSFDFSNISLYLLIAFALLIIFMIIYMHFPRRLPFGSNLFGRRRNRNVLGESKLKEESDEGSGFHEESHKESELLEDSHIESQLSLRPYDASAFYVKPSEELELYDEVFGSKENLLL
ncbi:hypothetical protein PRELSG_0015000 [Plasmodium relictum]|uniref:Uncharacterized protein n=1 Tax=Plasmodium relictum TaxID=85471 RepID=A0A1J1GKU8_PLARL|nr:hypothetical protein PRELSG_0015000 [Plasmodium relictum]CRG85760.1 hypothetical protein PRELSG_0015000 [Plasmodium relictum]